MLLSGCQDGEGFNLFQARPAATAATPANQTTRIVERDVEAPHVFQQTDRGLWDGRPSLGGVWVAHPDVTAPERVIIRNEADGNFVIGALFRRERVTPGPAFQVSSDAAVALGMLAGQPATLNVTALRREEVAEPVETDDAVVAVSNLDEIEETPLDPIEAASAAIDNVENSLPAAPEIVAVFSPEPEAEPESEPEPEAETTAAEIPAALPSVTTAASVPVQASGLEKPYIQIGIFNIESNASEIATSLRLAGMVPTVHDQSASGRRFWRVVVGPASNGIERAALLRKVRALDFSDAYFVSH